MAKLILYSGVVGSYDGAYDWARDKDERTPGWHKFSVWPEDECLIIDIPDSNIPSYPKGD